MSRLKLFIPLIIFMALAAVFLIQLNSDEDKTALPSPLIGKPFPQFILKTVESGEETNHLPEEPVLVNVWATWCKWEASCSGQKAREIVASASDWRQARDSNRCDDRE